MIKLLKLFKNTIFDLSEGIKTFRTYKVGKIK